MSQCHVQHAVELEVVSWHVAGVHGGTEALLVMAAVDPAIGQAVLYPVWIIVFHIPLPKGNRLVC